MGNKLTRNNKNELNTVGSSSETTMEMPEPNADKWGKTETAHLNNTDLEPGNSFGEQALQPEAPSFLALSPYDPYDSHQYHSFA